MDELNSKWEGMSKKTKKIQLKSTSFIKEITQRDKEDNKNDKEINKKDKEIIKVINDEDNIVGSLSGQDDQNIPQQPNSLNPYVFHKLSLISSLSYKNKLLHSIQENKLKYNQRFQSKQIHRQRFLTKITQSLSKVNSIHCYQQQQIFKNSYREQKSISNSNYRDQDEDISLTLSCDKQNTNRKQISQQKLTQNINHNQQINKENICISQTHSFIKPIQIHKKSSQKDQYILNNHQNTTQKQRKKILIKRNNKQSLQSSQHFTIQQSANKNNNKDCTQTSNITTDIMSKSKNQFMFLQQYQKDQKQIMNRLLNIIEQQIQTKNIPKQSKSKQQPIIKNQNIQQSNKKNQFASSFNQTHYNHGQTSIFMDQNLLNKQKKIKQLEQKRKTQKNINLSKQKQNKTILSQTVKYNHKTIQIEEPIQQSFFIQNAFKQLKVNNKHKDFNKSQKQLSKNMTFRQDSNQSPISDEQSDQQGINFQQLYLKLKQQEKQNGSRKKWSKKPSISLISSPQFSSINPSHQTSVNQILFNQTSTKKELNDHQFDGNNQQSVIKYQHLISKNNQNTSSHNVSQHLNQFNPNVSALSIQNKSTQQQKKQPILIEIPLDNQNTSNQTLSLADAFKKKFGNNKLSNKNKINDENKIKNSESMLPLSQLKHTQNAKNTFHQIPNLTLQSIAISNDFEKTLTKKNKSRSIKFNEKNKQNINSLQTPRTHSQKGKQTERSIKTNIIKQPPKQLIDRLIYGKKVSMSKKEMYELSKKNYMKLPEIQERKRQQEKKQKQIQRLQKIKQYQKRIRSGKHSLSKDSMKVSVDVDLNQ